MFVRVFVEFKCLSETLGLWIGSISKEPYPCNVVKKFITSETGILGA